MQVVTGFHIFQGVEIWLSGCCLLHSEHGGNVLKWQKITKAMMMIIVIKFFIAVCGSVVKVQVVNQQASTVSLNYTAKSYNLHKFVTFKLFWLSYVIAMYCFKLFRHDLVIF